MTENEYERGCKDYLVIEDPRRLKCSKTQTEPGWPAIATAKARRFSEAGGRKL